MDLKSQLLDTVVVSLMEYGFTLKVVMETKKTQNSGVVVKGEHHGQSIDFYGVLSDGDNGLTQRLRPLDLFGQDTAQLVTPVIDDSQPCISCLY